MNKRILFLLLCLIATLSVSAVSAIDDNVTEENLNTDAVSLEDVSYINQNSDSNNITSNNFSYNIYESDVVGDSISDTGSLREFQRLIDNASSGDTINLDKNYVYKYPSDMGLDITISKSLTINGNNYLIAGNKVTQFEISASYVTLNNLTLQHSQIIWSGLCGTLSNSTCAYINGSFFNNYGAIYWTGNLGTIINCTINNNYGSRYGGAVYISGSYNKIINSIFYSNNASFGGAIYWNSTNSSIVNCSFNNNIVTGASVGGAIYWKGENCQILNSTFEYNHVKLGQQGFGGAIAYYGKLGYISNCAFNGNDVYTGQGGAIVLDGIDCTIVDCNFTNNNASYGGAIFGSSYEILNCTFINNTASSNGGAVYLSGNKQEIIKCSFINNTVNGNPNKSDKLGNGGAIYLIGDDSNILNSNFINNSAHWSTVGGGAVYIDGNNSYTLNCSFLNNYVGYEGRGAISLNGDEGKLLNCSFTNNTAGFHGSGIRWKGANGLVANSNFTNNSRNVVYWFGDNGRLFNSNFINSTDANEGAALYWSGDNGDIDTCTFVNNTAKSSGGAIYCFENNNTNIKNCIFSNNTAKGGVWLNDGVGGAIYIVSNYNYFLNIGIVNCTFEENSALSGSAIYTKSNKLSIIDSIILNNRVGSKLLNLTPNSNNQSLDIILKGGNNLVNGIYAVKDVIFTNVTYYGINGITKTGKNVILEKTDCASNQTIFVEVYNKKSILVKNVTVKTDINGKSSLNLNDLASGTYNIKAYHDNSSYYAYISNSTTFIVKKNPTIKVRANDIIYGDGAFISITLLDRTDGNVTIKVANETYIRNISYYGGAGIYIENLDAGEYDVDVTFNGNAIYNPCSNTTKFNIFKQGTTMNVYVDDISVGDTAYVDINVNNRNVNDVAIIYINDVEYGTINLTFGRGVLGISDLKVGIYNVTAKFNGSKNYNMSVNSTELIVFGYSIDVPNVVKYYMGYEKLRANITDRHGNEVCGVNVTFNINGNNYIRKTDYKGIASMNINLGAGTYKVITTCAGSSVNSTVTVKPTVEAKDIVKMYQNDTQFYAKFLDNDGRILDKTKVQFNINGVFYTRETNSSGVAKLSINLRPGNYILTAINPYNGEQIGYNVTVKSLVEANNLTKYYKNESKFQATI
jgi:predicted outer membrane repeat protein